MKPKTNKKLKTFSLNQVFYFSLSEINEAHLESLANVTLNDNENMAALLDDVTIERTSSGRASNSVDSALLLKMPTSHGYAINNQEAPRADHDLIISGAQDSFNFKTVSNDVTRIGLPSHLGRIKSIYNMDIYV